MSKQILSEEFRRMQKLAGILNENYDNYFDTSHIDNWESRNNPNPTTLGEDLSDKTGDLYMEKEFTDEEDRKIKNIAIEANTKVGDYVKSIPTGRKNNFGNNINEFEATNPFTNEKVLFKRQGDASQYVINEIAKAITKKGREDIFKSILSKDV
jgi:hypothetical protein